MALNKQIPRLEIIAGLTDDSLEIEVTANQDNFDLSSLAPSIVNVVAAQPGVVEVISAAVITELRVEQIPT